MNQWAFGHSARNLPLRLSAHPRDSGCRGQAGSTSSAPIGSGAGKDYVLHWLTDLAHGLPEYSITHIQILACEIGFSESAAYRLRYQHSLR